ncbi:nickel-dependent hydrogenase large subunit [Roseospirillum parvum]|uniref:Coenzyme F420-reducing hydrogenase, alpha subunit n=1 Tax=Roseospirillum parvum TaxID=83401 RepID=A0A1G8B1H5_9PROT|nr:nickel-dependent hydrogenase large subunit [Roseospirillum parvum]SDH27006.1 Coenzyme F420-reducing hydrogenase, alpha subunit [Roseospirillum parvum]
MREPTLNITLVAVHQAVSSVTVSGWRPAEAAPLLLGQPPGAVVDMVGRLFTLCRVAQTVATLDALEAALGIEAAPAVRASRQALVLAEALEQGALRLLLEAPRLVGGAPERDTLRAFVGQLKAVAARAEVAGWNRLGGGPEARSRGGPPGVPPGLAGAVADLEPMLEDLLLGGGRLPETTDQLATWSGQGLGARVVAQAADEPPCPLPPPPGLDADLAELGGVLGGPGAVGFLARPTWRGQARETGPLPRHARAPLIAHLINGGHLLVARLLARLMDLWGALADLRALAQGAPAAPPMTCLESPGRALAAVETARGRLIHHVAVADGRVAGWRALPPTAWNFHPSGVLSRALIGQPATDRAALERRAHLLILALDPCLAYHLTVKEGG